MTNPPPPYPPQQPSQHPGQYPPPPPPKKRKVWPWILLAVIVLMFGGCFALIGTAGHEASKALDAAASSIQSAAPATGDQSSPASVPHLTAKPQGGPGKTIVYEIISDSRNLNSVTYYDEQSDLQQETGSSAPWTKTVVNKSTVAIAGLGAQTSGTSVTCRITIDGKVKDEKTSTGKYAVVNCTAPLI
ncbi:MmpS family transport accessory protein [Nocardia sp. NPDC004068]|uniref:MmpS family transport accessory protein n=1 Tax=Nocardia sp. NPDC004068 TaxID=3364303 RepID=UPI0036929680